MLTSALTVTPSMAKFTKMRLSISGAVLGYALKNILPRALSLKLQIQASGDDAGFAVSAEAVGAGDNDAAVVMKKRRRGVGDFLSDPATEWKLVLALAAGEPLDKLTHGLFGHRKQRPSWEDVRGLITETQSALLKMLSTWAGSEGSAWRLVRILGLEHKDLPAMRLWARTACLIFSAGVCMRMELRMTGLLETLLLVLDDGISEQRRAKIVADFYAVDIESMDAMSRAIRKAFPTSADLMTTFGRECLYLFKLAHRFSVDWSERDHARAKKIFQGSTRCFNRYSDRSFTLGMRSQHLEAGGLGE